MEHRNPKKTHAMLRFDLMIAGALALAVGLFALLYSGGGVAILTAAATEDNGEEQYPSGSPLPEVSPTPPSPTPSQAPVSTEGRLIPYMENGLWGYKNTKGEVAIEPRFSAAYEFDGATAFAAENGYYGLLAKNGIWIVEPIWEAVEAFSEGRAAVESGGKWGFIDENGTLVIDYKFREVGSFHCGRAIARSAASYGYIDVNGDIAVSQKWTAAGDFSEDVAFVRSESDNSYIIDKVGEKIATLSSRQYGSPFCEGFALIREEGSSYYLNSRGQTAFKEKYQDALSFNGGYAAVCQDGLWGYINTKGVLVIPNAFAAAQSFSGGLAAVKDATSDLWGYIVTDGKYIIQPAYEEAQPFSDGFAVIKQDGVYFIINRPTEKSPLSPILLYRAA